MKNRIEDTPSQELITGTINTLDPRRPLGMKRTNLILMAIFLVSSVFFIHPVMAGFPEAPVNLGSAGDFVILGKTAITTTGGTNILGNIGISPAAASFMTGFALILDSSNQFATSFLVDGQVLAATYAPPTPTLMTTAISDMETAYTNAAGRTLPDSTEFNGGDLTNQSRPAGLHKWGGDVLINSPGFTLTGSSTDVWIFQIAGKLTVNSGAIVTLAGGALAKNVFWQVADTVFLGTTVQMKGIILAQTNIEMLNGAVLDGRALAQTAVTLDNNDINTPAGEEVVQVVVPPETVPTLSEWGIIGLIVVLGVAAASRVRKFQGTGISPTLSA